MIHLAKSGRLEPVCFNSTAILITDDRRQVTCRACLELAPSRLAQAVARAYADGVNGRRLRVRRVIRVPVGTVGPVTP